MDLETDYIEPDLCLSQDGIFVALHDLFLDDTTNVASLSQFNDKKTTKVVDGKNMTGYFVSDFVYSELQELRLNQRLSYRTTLYNGLFQIPSLDSVMSLVQSHYYNTSRTIGIYVELKHPSFFHSLGFNMENMLLQSLVKGGYEVNGDNVPTNLTQVLPVVIQCFESDSLKYLKEKTNIPLIQLLEVQKSDFFSNDNINTISTYSNGIGPAKENFGNIPYELALNYVNLIHSFGLVIHPYTFRADSGIGNKFNNNFEFEEMFYYCCLGY